MDYGVGDKSPFVLWWPPRGNDYCAQYTVTIILSSYLPLKGERGNKGWEKLFFPKLWETNSNKNWKTIEMNKQLHKQIHEWDIYNKK